MNSGKAFIYKKEDILNVVNSQKTEMKNVNFQCNLTPKSSVASWTDTDVDRNLGDKLLGPRPDALNKINNFGSNYSLSDVTGRGSYVESHSALNKENVSETSVVRQLNTKFRSIKMEASFFYIQFCFNFNL